MFVSSYEKVIIQILFNSQLSHEEIDYFSSKSHLTCKSVSVEINKG